MIEITFIPGELKLTVTGHAGAAEKGKDIVCSAVSVLVYTLVKAIEESRGMLAENPVFEITEGSAEISCKPEKGFLPAIQRTYWTVLCGFELLCSSQGNYVTFVIDETEQRKK